MNQKHLLRFVKKCMRTRADEQVCLDKDKKPMTLQQVKFSPKIIGELVHMKRVLVYVNNEGSEPWLFTQTIHKLHLFLSSF